MFSMREGLRDREAPAAEEDGLENLYQAVAPYLGLVICLNSLKVGFLTCQIIKYTYHSESFLNENWRGLTYKRAVKLIKSTVFDKADINVQSKK